jgi:hypothetical protein
VPDVNILMNASIVTEFAARALNAGGARQNTIIRCKILRKRSLQDAGFFRWVSCQRAATVDQGPTADLLLSLLFA